MRTKANSVSIAPNKAVPNRRFGEINWIRWIPCSIKNALPAAKQAYAESKTIGETLTRDNPNDFMIQRQALRSLDLNARLQQADNKPAFKVIEALEQAARFAEQLLAKNPMEQELLSMAFRLLKAHADYSTEN